MSSRKSTKRPRDKYSRLICQGCRDRRIRCELPDDAEIPEPGEWRATQTPCYRCKRLGAQCVIRQTVLGRPAAAATSHSATVVHTQRATAGGISSRVIVDLTVRSKADVDSVVVSRRLPSDVSLDASSYGPASSGESSFDGAAFARQMGDALLVHKPQCPETVLIIRALDTLHCEKVQDKWFRHLAAYVYRTHALELCVKALVAACAYGRGVPGLSVSNTYRALALALRAIQDSIRQPHGEDSDTLLASIALLAPFEGTLKKHGILTRSHVDGLAALLLARPTTYPATQIAMEIIDFHAAESAIMACMQGAPSPFEHVPRAYFALDRNALEDRDQLRLKAVTNELFVHIPRLVMTVRTLRLQPHPDSGQLAEALRFAQALLRLQDHEAEMRVLGEVTLQPSSVHEAASCLNHSMRFASMVDFEALVYYWQSRLSLLRLQQRLDDLTLACHARSDGCSHTSQSVRPTFGPKTDGMSRLAHNIMMCVGHAGELPLRTQNRLIAHAVVTVWGASTDEPEIFGSRMGREIPNNLSDLLLRSANSALSAKPQLISEDMAVAAEIFVGGSLGGRFAEFYSW